jgi:hypothetical protein
VHAEDRQAFDTIIAEMFGAIDKPLGEATREAFWKGLQRMSIVELSRCRDQLLDDLQEGERPRTFGVPNVWALKNRLRAIAPEKRADDGWRGDDWDVRANHRLLAYVLKAAVHRRHFDVKQTHVLVAMKHRWAELMRRSADGSTELDRVPMEDQNQVWGACMGMAEETIAAKRVA